MKRAALSHQGWIFIALMLVTGLSNAQSIENVRAEVFDKTVRITYDLNGKAEQRFHVSVYGSHNNFTAPLRLVSGAVGDNLAPGKLKTIEWRIGDELVTFTGQISFRLRGEVMAGPLTLQSPSANSTIKIGKTSNVRWTGGNPSSAVRVELLQDGRVVKAIHEGTNSGAFAWSVPKDDIVKGSYQIRLTAGSETSQAIPIEIKAGMPLWAKLAPVVIVGAAVAVIFLLPDPTEPPPNGGDELPDAPSAPVD